MEIVKVLERKAVIRLFGIGLILSPFFNTFLTMLTYSHVRDQWSWRVFWFISNNRPLADQILYITTFIIGILMLRGASWAWKCLLVLLGAYIVNQTLHFGPNFRANKFSAIFFMMNVGIFIFIADQLAWKFKKPVVNKPQSTAGSPIGKVQQNTEKQVVTKPIANTPDQKKKSNRKILISFEDIGPWAQLAEISKDGVRVNSLREAPKGIETQEIEMQLSRQVKLRVRYSRHLNSDYYFHFIDLSPEEVKQINAWLLQIAA